MFVCYYTVTRCLLALALAARIDGQPLLGKEERSDESDEKNASLSGCLHRAMRGDGRLFTRTDVASGYIPAPHKPTGCGHISPRYD